MGGPGRYPDELRERAVRLVFEQQGQYDSQWEAIESIAEKVGCSGEALRKWVRKAEHAKVKKPAVPTAESAKVAELEREVRELRRANEILRKASAYFAQAELDRRPK
jgi:transposase